jgi:hypothetical protein
MFRVRRNGTVVDRSPAFRIAKQVWRRKMVIDPKATWTVTDSRGRIVLPSMSGGMS